MLPEPLAVTLQVIDALDELGIPYWIGGSLASALHGVARATLDTALVVDLAFEHVALLVAALGSAFFVDDEMIRGAVAKRTSFNLIHQKTMFKVDVFLLKDRPFDRIQLERRT